MLAAFYKNLFFTFAISIFLPVFVLAQSGLVNINTAGLSELKTLDGIDDVKAQAIIDYRTVNGPFQNILDIKNVSGIGDVTYANIKDFITVGSVTLPVENNNSDSTPTLKQSASASSSTLPKKSENVTFGAGTDRSGTVGSPIEFKAETNLEYGNMGVFTWNFGDGSLGYGSTLTHTYEYAGDYVVVLTMSLPEGSKMAKINVKILDPEITITLATPERIVLKSSSLSDANLFGRVLLVGNNSFIFPRTTHNYS